MDLLLCLILMMSIMLIIPIGASGVKIIYPHHCGVLLRQGKPREILYPGFYWIAPLISKVYLVDMRQPTWRTELERFSSPDYDRQLRELVFEIKKRYPMAWDAKG